MEPGYGSTRSRLGGIHRLLALMFALSLILAACGTADPADTTSDDGTDTTADGGTDTTAAPSDDPAEGAGTAAETYEKFNAMTGQERTDALVAAAQEEGILSFYSAGSGMDPIIGAFEEEYGIDVEFFRGLSDTVLQRVIQEYDSGFYGVDIFDDAEAFSLNDAGLTHLYVNDELTEPIPGYDPERHVVPTRLSVYVTGWNTDLVSEDEIPATLDGFADPSWEGRLGVEPGDWDWYSGIVDYYTQEEGWTEEEVDEMMASIASNASFHDGHTTLAQLMLAGEFAVSPTLYTQSVDRELEADADAPVAWRKSDGSFVEPILFFPQGSVLMKNAPHPAAAMLFMDFMVTRGQEILALEDRTPTAVVQPGGPLEGIDTDKLYPMDIDKFLNERDEWIARFDELLRGS
jgi:iron(III) transport system substrate-binding protein